MVIIPELEDRKAKYITGDLREGLTVYIIKKDYSHYWGLTDFKGRILVSPKYRQIEKFSEGMAVVYSQDIKYGFINLAGIECIPCKWRHAKEFSEGISPVSAGEIGKELYYFIDYSGNIVFNTNSPNANPFSCGLASISNKSFFNKYGFIDKRGALIVPLIYSSVTQFREGYAFVNKSWFTPKYGIIDVNGDLCAEFAFQTVQHFDDGVAIVSKNNEYGIINSSKLEFESLGKYYSLLRIDKNCYLVKANKKDSEVKILDGKFNLITTIQVDDVHSCYADFKMIVFKKNKGYGLMNLNGDMITGPAYKNIYQMDWNIAWCHTRGGNSVYINSAGKII